MSPTAPAGTTAVPGRVHHPSTGARLADPEPRTPVQLLGHSSAPRGDADANGMRWLRGSGKAALVALGLAVAASPALAARSGSEVHWNRSFAATTPSRTGIVLNERVRAAGTYEVVVRIRTRARGVVDLQIGAIKLHASSWGGTRRVTVHRRVRVGGHRLTIRASSRRTTSKINVSWSRVHRRHRAHGPGTKSSTTPAKSAGGSTTSAVPASGVATAAVAPTAPAVAPEPSSPPAPTPVTTAAAGPPGNAASWHEIFDDEFNGTSLDTSKWSTGWLGSGITAPVNPEELQCYDPSQVSEGGGALDLSLIAKSESCGGQTRAYASGIVTTMGHFTYTYGYIEARVWAPGTTSVTDWPAVWTDGASWPTDGEQDVFEGLGGQACWHFHDPAGAPGGCSPGTFTGGWHTVGADWEPGSVTYYYDGVPVGSVTSGVTSAPMAVILDLAVDSLYGGPVQAPAKFMIDYVRIWQH